MILYLVEYQIGSDRREFYVLRNTAQEAIDVADGQARKDAEDYVEPELRFISCAFVTDEIL